MEDRMEKLLRREQENIRFYPAESVISPAETVVEPARPGYPVHPGHQAGRDEDCLVWMYF